MSNQRIIVTPPGPKAKEILERDSKVLSPSYARDYPFVMERGQGAQGAMSEALNGKRKLNLSQLRA